MVTIDRYFPASFIEELEASLSNVCAGSFSPKPVKFTRGHEAVSTVEKRDGCDIILIKDWRRGL